MAANLSPFDPPSDNMRGRVTHGVVTTGAAQLVRLAVQFGSVVVLSRLLDPTDFGLMAMVGPFVALVALFQDLGFSQAAIQKPLLTDAEANKLFWYSVISGFVCGTFLIAFAPFVSWFYGDPRTGQLAAATSILVLLGSLCTQHLAILSRRMQFGKLALIETSAALFGFLTTLTLAILHPSYWALYAGNLVAGIVPLVGSWLGARWIPSSPFVGSHSPELVRFGAGITGFNLANYFSRNFDNILIGHRSGELALGLYDRAYKLLLMPLQQVVAPFARVMIPALSRTVHDSVRYRRSFLIVQRQMLLITVPGMVFLIMESHFAVPLLLGPKWADAAPIFAALGFAGVVQPLNNPTGWLFITQSRVREFMLWGIFSAATNVVAFVLGLPYGPTGVAVAYAASEYVRTPILWWYVTRTGPISLRDVAVSAAPCYLSAIVSVCCVYVLKGMTGMPLVAEFSIGLIASYAITLLVAMLSSVGRSTVLESFQAACNYVRRDL